MQDRRIHVVALLAVAVATVAFALLVDTPPAMAQAQRCQQPNQDCSFCAVDGGTCNCDFRRTEKNFACDPAFPSCHGNPGAGLPFWPGDHIIMTLTLCNDGVQDPKECAHGQPQFGNPWNIKDPNFSVFYIENAQITDRNGQGPTWDPANPDLFTAYRPAASDGCQVDANGDLGCVTNNPPAGLGVMLNNGQCYTLEYTGMISLTHPCTPNVCNQVLILDPTNPLPLGPLLGCSSRPPQSQDGQQTCYGFECSGTIDVTKTVSPATFMPGDLLHYRLCLRNTQTTIASSVSILDYLPDDPTDGLSWINKVPSCVRNFLWDNPNITGVQTSDLGCANDDDPSFQIYGFDLGPDGSNTANVCFEWDMVTDATNIPNGTSLCNPNTAPPGQDSIVDWNGSPQPIIFGRDAVSQACSDYSVGPSFATATKDVDVTLAGAGDPVNYHFAICNTGTQPADNFVLTDVLPDCFDFAAFDYTTDVRVTDNGLGGNTQVNWNGGQRRLTVSVINGETFDVGDCMYVDIGLVVSASPPSSCQNFGTMTWDNAPRPVETNRATFNTTQQANLLAVKAIAAINGVPPTPPAIGEPNQSVHYTVTLTNSGTGPATNVTFVEPWDGLCIDASQLQVADVTVTGSSTAPTVTINPGNFTVTITGMTVAVGTPVTIQINPNNTSRLIVSASATDNYNCCNLGNGTYVASVGNPPVNYSTTDNASTPPPSPTCFTVNVPVANESNLTATKSASPTTASQGAAVSFQIVLRETNNNGTDATETTVTDTLDAGCLDFAALTTADIDVQGSSSGPIIDWTPPTITISGITVASGGQVTIDINPGATRPNLAISGTAPNGPCCNDADITYLSRRGDPTSQKTVTPAPSACINVGGTTANFRREAVTNSECPLTGRPASPDTMTIFQNGITVQGTQGLPYNDAGYRVSGATPPGNSCLLFYQHDSVVWPTTKLYVVPGDAPTTDVKVIGQ